MTPSSKRAVEKHLSFREYDLKEVTPGDQTLSIPLNIWQFLIAPDLQAQLTCLEPIEDDMTCIMVLSIPIESSSEVDLFISAISLALSPVDVILMPGEIALRVCAKGNRESLPDLLDELVILIRHASGMIALPAVRLANGELTLQQAMDTFASQSETQKDLG